LNTGSFIKNTLSNYAILFLKLLFSLISLPVCLYAYGPDMYGVYLLSFGLSISLIFLDFGSGKSLLRYAAEYMADRDTQKFQAACNANFSLNVLSCLLIVVLLSLLGVFSDQLFNIPPQLHETAIQLFMLSALNAVFVFIDYLPANILSGMGKFHTRNKLQLVPLVINFMAIGYLWKYQDMTVIQFAVVMICSSALSAGLDYYLIHKEFIHHHIRLRLHFSKKMFQNEYARYTRSIFILSAIGFLGIQADRLIISGVRDVSQLTLYTIITRPYFLIKGLFANIYAVLQPSLVNVKNSATPDKLHPMIRKFTATSFLVLFAFVCGCCIFFEPLLHAWLGTDQYDAYTAWGMLALLNICIPALYGPLSRTLLMSDHVHFLARTNTVLILINAFISIVLTIYIGFPGVIIGTTVQMIMEYFLINIWGAKKINFSPWGIFTGHFTFSCIILICLTVAVRISISLTTELAAGIFAILAGCSILLVVARYLKKENILSRLHF